METISIPKVIVPPCFINDPSVLSHWRFELRREAQHVASTGVFVGPLAVLRDRDFLDKNNIRTLISFTEPHNNAVLYKHHYMAAQSSRFNCMQVDPGSALSLVGMVSEFPRICQAIDETKQAGGCTLLFCETGNDKAAAAAAAYLIYSEGLGAIEAIQTVCRARFCVSLNESIKYSLLTWQDICFAQAQVSGSGNGDQSQSFKRRQSDDESVEESYGDYYMNNTYDPGYQFDGSCKRTRS